MANVKGRTGKCWTCPPKSEWGYECANNPDKCVSGSFGRYKSKIEYGQKLGKCKYTGKPSDYCENDRKVACATIVYYVDENCTSSETNTEYRWDNGCNGLSER